MKRFVAVGECMIELSAGGAPNNWNAGVAGDTFNTTWYVKRLLGAEWQVDYVTRLGTDTFSTTIADFMQASGIGTGHVTFDPARRPGLYVIEVDAEGERRFAYWRGESAARGMADAIDALTAAFADSDVIFLSGITMAILPPLGRANLLAALLTAQSEGRMIVFDPNYRAALWASRDEARSAIRSVAELSTLVLPSFDDEAALFGDADPDACLRRYRELGVPEIVVKNGGKDVSFAVEDHTGRVVDLERVSAVDTTGAGDGFNAGYVAGRACRLSPEESIAVAHAVASQIVKTRGALVDLVPTNLRRNIAR